MTDAPYMTIIGLGHTWFRLMDFKFRVTAFRNFLNGIEIFVCPGARRYLWHFWRTGG